MKAYEQTLFQYHPPLVRKAVGLAVYTLPSREAFLKKVNFQGDANVVIAKFVSDLQPIHNFLHEYYIKRNIQNVM